MTDITIFQQPCSINRHNQLDQLHHMSSVIGERLPPQRYGMRQRVQLLYIPCRSLKDSFPRCMILSPNQQEQGCCIYLKLYKMEIGINN